MGINKFRGFGATGLTQVVTNGWKKGKAHTLNVRNPLLEFWEEFWALVEQWHGRLQISKV